MWFICQDTVVLLNWTMDLCFFSIKFLQLSLRPSTLMDWVTNRVIISNNDKQNYLIYSPIHDCLKTLKYLIPFEKKNKPWLNTPLKHFSHFSHKMTGVPDNITYSMYRFKILPYVLMIYNLYILLCKIIYCTILSL